MPKINFRKHIAPHLIALLIFAVVSILFFSPVVFNGEHLFQHDIYQWQGGAKELIDFRNKTGEEGLWTNSMFSGMPGYLVNVEFSGDLVKYLQAIYYLGLPHPVRILFSAFISFYILMLAFGVRPTLAIGGSLAFGLSSFNIVGIIAGHNARIFAIAYMPLVLAGIHICLKKNALLGTALTALGMALELKSNHLQITYYLLLIVFIYGATMLYQAIKEGELKKFVIRLGFLAVAVLIALGTNLGRLWTILEYNKYSIRGKSELTQSSENASGGLDRDYAFRFSNGKLETLTLFIPNVMGGPSTLSLDDNSHLGQAMRTNGVPPAQRNQYLKNTPTYWGNQPLTAPYYAGAIIVFLFVLGLFTENKYVKTWIIASVILGILLSWGSNFSSFNNFLFDHLPGYNKFRSVTFAIIIPIFLIPLLGITGLQSFLDDTDKKKNKKLFRALGIAGGIAFLFFAFAGMASFRGAIDSQLSQLPAWFIQALREDRESLMRTDAFRTLAFILAAGIVIMLIHYDKLKSMHGLGLLVFLIGIDSFAVSKRYISEDNYRETTLNQDFVATDADKAILQDPSKDYRVFYLIDPFNEARTSYFHESIGGYHGAKMKRYQDLIEHYITPEANLLIEDYRAGMRRFNDYNVLNMLNTKYFVTGPNKNSVLTNDGALGNAWLVKEIIKANSPDEELANLAKVDPGEKAVVDFSKFPLSKSEYLDSGTISLDEYEPNYLKYTANLAGESFAVFSEIYYPVGWEATIDGKPLSIIRANYVLRAAVLPAGNHVIEFSFKPNSYYVGNKIMLVFSLILVALLIVAFYRSFKNYSFT